MPEKIVCIFVYITTSISDIYMSQCMVVDTWNMCSIHHSFLYISSIQCHSIALKLQLIVLPISVTNNTKHFILSFIVQFKSKNVQVGNDQEIVQSERNFHSIKVISVLEHSVTHSDKYAF